MRATGVHGFWAGTMLAAAFAASGSAAADVFRYVDEAGVVHFTNAPVDPRFEPEIRTDRGLRSRELRRVAGPPRIGLYDSLILDAGRDESVQPALLKAVIAAESNFDPDAISSSGARGLMQLMPRTAEALGVEDAFEPEQNIRAGARYLAKQIERFGDLRSALAAYNAGPAVVRRHQGVPPFRETQDYVDRVLIYYVAYGDAF